MEKITFKLRRLPKSNTKVRNIIINNPDMGTPIYEYQICYVPERYGDDNRNVKHYRVYFWKDAGYWSYINNCSKQDFEKFIAPRILRNTKLLNNG